MGQNKQEFLNVRMSMEIYSSLEQKQKDQMEIRNVFEKGWDEELKKNPAYNRIKKESVEKYKELKEVEFIITNKNK